MNEYLLGSLVLGLVTILTGGAAWLFKVHLPGQQQMYRDSLAELQATFSATLTKLQETFERTAERSAAHQEKIIDKVATDNRESLARIESMMSRRGHE